jgi:acyl carrier protein
MICAQKKRSLEKSMDTLINELKHKIIETLRLEDIAPHDIAADDQLVGGVLEIDSIDILELVIMIEKEYAVIIDNKELGEKVFSTLHTLADHIRKNRKDPAH